MAAEAIPDPNRFSREIGISIAGHILVVAVIFLQAVLVPRDPIEIRNAIRVDIVGLPDKIAELPEPVKTPVDEPAAVKEPTPKPEAPVKELPIKEKSPPPKTETPAVPDPKAKKASMEKSQNKALDKIKAMQALDKIKQEVGAKTGAKPQVVKGNEVAAGNSLTGLDKIAYDRYFHDVETKVRGAWNIPQWLAESEFKAQIQVLIDSDGTVIRKIFRRTSGNDIFDAKVLEAIDSSSPLPVPPDRLRGLLRTSGIVFNFPQ